MADAPDRSRGHGRHHRQGIGHGHKHKHKHKSGHRHGHKHHHHRRDSEDAHELDASVDRAISRDEITLEGLRKLRKFFGKDKRGLPEREFVSKLGSIMGKGLTAQKLSELFMKIDVNSDGTVDWEEFTNFMFLDSKETRQDEPDLMGDHTTHFKTSDPGLVERLNGGQKAHRDSVRRLLMINDGNQLLSCSRDGTVCTWNPSTLLLTKRIKTIAPREEYGLGKADAKGTDYVTDCVYCASNNRLGIGSVNNGVAFFDATAPNRRLAGLLPLADLGNAAPMALENATDATGRELMLIGDDVGGIHGYTINHRFWNYCERNATPLGHADAKSMQRFGLKPGRSISQLADKSKRVGPEVQRFAAGHVCAHTDHVTSIQYVKDLNCFVTSSLDSTLNVVDLERFTSRRKYAGHEKAVYTFAWVAQSKVVASAGLERQIVLWSPYSERAVANLTGHTSSVRLVTTVDDQNKLISVGTDNIVKVWDVRNNKCIQTLSEAKTSTASVGHDLTSILYDYGNKQLLAASSTLRRWKLENMLERPEEKSHEYPVVSALYNRGFNQVVSGDIENNVCVWDADTGRLVSRFDTTVEGRERSQLTAMCFDNGGRRLITGSHKGDGLQVWNFSNGCPLTTLEKGTMQVDEDSEPEVELPKSPRPGEPGADAPPGVLAVIERAPTSPDKEFLPGVTPARQLPTRLPRMGKPIKLGALAAKARGVGTFASASGTSDGAAGSSNGMAVTGSKSPLQAFGRGAAKKGGIFAIATKEDDPRGRSLHQRTAGESALAAGPGTAAGKLSHSRGRKSKMVPVRERTKDAEGMTKMASAFAKAANTKMHMVGGGLGVLGGSFGDLRLAPEGPIDGETPLEAKDRLKLIIKKVADKKRRRHEQGANEISAIAYCVYNVPRLRGQPAIQNKFVICAGWETQAHVWRDEGSTHKRQGFLMKVPDDADVGHTDDVLCVAFCPPNIFASGGYDGKTFLWNINSRDVHATFDMGAPVESMCYIDRLALLAVASANGMMYFINARDGTPFDELDAHHMKQHSLCALRTDPPNDYLFTGDSGGHVKVWELATSDSTDVLAVEMSHWQAHETRITNIDYVENPRVLDTFVVTCCLGGEICVWTLGGVKVGMFGQREGWRLDQPDTYVDSEAKLIEPPPVDFLRLKGGVLTHADGHGGDDGDDDDDDDDDDDYGAGTGGAAAGGGPRAATRKASRLAMDRRRSSGAKRASGAGRAALLHGIMAPGNNQSAQAGSQGGADARRMSRRASRKSSAGNAHWRRKSIMAVAMEGLSAAQAAAMDFERSQELQRRANDDFRPWDGPREGDVWFRKGEHGMFLNVVTITRVDELQNIISGYDGLALSKEADLLRGAPMITFKFTEFQKLGFHWERDNDMTSRIGRVFHDARQPYKVLYVRAAAGRWVLVDADLKEHVPPPLDTSARPTRSLSILERRASVASRASRASVSYTKTRDSDGDAGAEPADDDDDDDDDDDGDDDILASIARAQRVHADASATAFRIGPGGVHASDSPRGTVGALDGAMPLDATPSPTREMAGASRAGGGSGRGVSESPTRSLALDLARHNIRGHSAGVETAGASAGAGAGAATASDSSKPGSRSGGGSRGGTAAPKQRMRKWGGLESIGVSTKSILDATPGRTAAAAAEPDAEPDAAVAAAAKEYRVGGEPSGVAARRASRRQSQSPEAGAESGGSSAGHKTPPPPPASGEPRRGSGQRAVRPSRRAAPPSPSWFTTTSGRVHRLGLFTADMLEKERREIEEAQRLADLQSGRARSPNRDSAAGGGTGSPASADDGMGATWVAGGARRNPPTSPVGAARGGGMLRGSKSSPNLRSMESMGPRARTAAPSPITRPLPPLQSSASSASLRPRTQASSGGGGSNSGATSGGGASSTQSFGHRKKGLFAMMNPPSSPDRASSTPARELTPVERRRRTALPLEAALDARRPHHLGDVPRGRSVREIMSFTDTFRPPSMQRDSYRIRHRDDD